MSSTHWKNVARQFRNFGPPLRPCKQDVAIVNRMLADYSSRPLTDGLRVLACGVTPELTGVRWPSGVKSARIFDPERSCHTVTMTRSRSCGNRYSLFRL